MKFDKPLSVSANGGHGPIRYFVEEYEPGKRVVFRFTGPNGFDGCHGYDVFELEKDKTGLRETLKMNKHAWNGATIMATDISSAARCLNRGLT